MKKSNVMIHLKMRMRFKMTKTLSMRKITKIKNSTRILWLLTKKMCY